ncbi:hypothetical protein M9Y10_010570 [Tritrichomonas musculus]|uniref:F5/8 type C domain-containing protein n=1 Tax=Tritrichomonas musculus TaxID=1915356 RepID=A0ABR2IME8_9EUKA
MKVQSKIHLDSSCILNVPLHSYDEFVFLVNDEVFKTTRLISDLLSPKICKIHISDPTINEFTIKTHHKGNFSYILDLANFKQNDIPNEDLPFVIEVIDQLENEFIEITDSDQSTILTFDNVFQLIKENQQHPNFYSKHITTEIDFISSHLFELPSEQEDELISLDQIIIEKILRNPLLKIESEDQLISLINRLYMKDISYSTLYGYVFFSFVSDEKINEFIENFDYNDLTKEIWDTFSKRCAKVRKDENKSDRYKQKDVKLLYEENHEFEGIISYLKKKSNGDIDKLLAITSSKIESQNTPAKHAIDFEDKNHYFSTGPIENRWICFDFKENKVNMTHYTIRNYKGTNNPKSWIIEGKNEEGSDNWETIDERNNEEEWNHSHFSYSEIYRKRIPLYTNAINWR